MQISRRTFVGTGAAAIGALTATSTPADAQLIYQHNDWKFAEFNALLKQPARVKQLYHVRAIAEGGFLFSIKNSLNGLHFGFEIPADQIKIAVAAQGPANMLNFDDSMWEKYRFGEFLKLNDPLTNKPAVRNIYFAKQAVTSTDPEDSKSIFQDTGIERLETRGVKFLSCHNSNQVLARELVEKNSLKISPEDLVKDLQTHTVPGVLVVPAMVAAITLLQSEGHYTYITI